MIGGQPRPGTLVTPSVRLARQLGQGGMGSVWLADHLTLHSQVVVKFMSAELASEPESVSRFSREAAAASQVRSPHVVQIFDHGVTAEGLPFIVMELLEGQDLARHLARVGRLPREEVVAIVTQIAKALAKAHGRGIVHRDIKPENVFLVREEGETIVKLLDFGIAKTADPMNATRTGAMIGTPFYMSPEQSLGARSIDFRSDLWSLGVLVFQLATGARPFVGETIGALTLAIHHGPIPVPSSLVPELGPSFDAWFARACARDPAARFESAKQMAQALATSFSLDVPGVQSNPFSADASSESHPQRAQAVAETVLAPAPGLSTTGGTASARPPTFDPTEKGARRSSWPLAFGVVALGLIGTFAYLRTRTSPPVEPPKSAASPPSVVSTSAPVQTTSSAASPSPSAPPSAPSATSSAPPPVPSTKPKPLSSATTKIVTPKTTSTATAKPEDDDDKLK
ncbi:MAG: serine/threonine-protein kinase [Polyangiales bacterium]